MSAELASQASRAGALIYPFETPPAHGAAIEVAPDVLWMRLPLPMALDHVNVFAFADDDGWTLIDTGMASNKTRRIWQGLLEGPLVGRPVKRVLVTHHHPDHIGLAGWFQSEFGAELITTRTAWLFARMLQMDEQAVAPPEAVEFWRSAGVNPDMLAKRQSERPFNFADVVAPMPLGFRRIRQGSVLRFGGRTWDVHIGNGHAPEHATLWSREDNLVIGGDQLLASISPNIGVYPTEPDADPLHEWLEACERLSAHALPDQLVLPGHKLPFSGLPFRMGQLIENHHSALRRLVEALRVPKVAEECFPVLFKRSIGEGEYGLALVESVAHLNHLLATGRVTRQRREDGAWLWRAV